jgi:hypothetical protein
MKRSSIVIALLMAATSVKADVINTAECRSQLQDCYAAITARCGTAFRIVDRQQYFGDILFRELPGWATYNTILYTCEKN